MWSPCSTTSPPTCTPCLSSAPPSRLWTVRAVLLGLTLRELTRPSTGRWVTENMCSRNFKGEMCKDKHDDKTKTTLINSYLKQMIHSQVFTPLLCSLCTRTPWTWSPSSPAWRPRSTVTCTVKAAASAPSTPTWTGHTTSPTCWATASHSSQSSWGCTSPSTGDDLQTHWLIRHKLLLHCSVLGSH